MNHCENGKMLATPANATAAPERRSRDLEVVESNTVPEDDVNETLDPVVEAEEIDGVAGVGRHLLKTEEGIETVRLPPYQMLGPPQRVCRQAKHHQKAA
ncbi:hypothetical protein RvY_00336 [Ramazzottius varieornatus]|uniref:Uncharacterized protein n=1 Tax=Ramazzottius varieornatus TaxID=947166 RepID=A0A1D1UCF6_RAMVA|nr:hypothetical protein RvY_00336 [Ramazzottius varieornatus]